MYNSHSGALIYHGSWFCYNSRQDAKVKDYGHTEHNVLKHAIAQRLNERMAYLSVRRQKEQWFVEITVVPSFIPAENHINPVFLILFCFGVKFVSEKNASWAELRVAGLNLRGP